MASDTFVTKILTNDLIYDNILHSVDPCTLVRLARTCRTAHAAVQSHVIRSFNINTHFSRYFADPLAFRSLQATTGTLVSGSNALQFLDRSFWPESDLDLYCFYEARADVGEWLQEQGYTFEPRSRYDDPSFHVAVAHPREPQSGYDIEEAAGSYEHVTSISSIYTFLKTGKNSQGEDTQLKVQVIVACDNPMETILGFHSTLVLNVISYSHAYSLYPRATFHHRVSLELLAEFDRAAWGVVEKYNSRGWCFIYDEPRPDGPALASHTARSLSAEKRREYLQKLREDKNLALAFPKTLRWIGDSHSWVLSLPIEGVQVLPNIGFAYRPNPLAHDPSIATTWRMIDGEKRFDDDDDPWKKLDLTCRKFSGFRYSYVITDPMLRQELDIMQRRYRRRLAAADGPLAIDYYDQEFLDYCKAVLKKQRWSQWYRLERPY